MPEKKDIEKWLEEQGQYNPFPKRESREEIVPIHADFQKVLLKLDEYSKKLMSFSQIGSRGFTLNQWIVLHFQKRALSSPAALRHSINNRITEIDRRLKKDEVEVISANHKEQRVPK